ncbi:MAG: hypothetical protein HWD59_11865 [Coxiellaceae bacterium]|nr:MAG: hypothetical protein HWD59_11865 [Coxiellaceae bacterium]
MNIRKTIGPILLLSWALASFAEKEPVIVMTPTDRSSNVSDMWSDEEGATNSNTSISPVTENTVVPVAPVKVEASSKQSSKHKAHSPMTTHYYGPTTSKDNIWEIAKNFGLIVL